MIIPDPFFFFPFLFLPKYPGAGTQTLFSVFIPSGTFSINTHVLITLFFVIILNNLVHYYIKHLKSLSSSSSFTMIESLNTAQLQYFFLLGLCHDVSFSVLLNIPTTWNTFTLKLSQALWFAQHCCLSEVFASSSIIIYHEP